MAPFAPEQRSVGKVKEAFYRFLQFAFPIKFGYGDPNSQMVILAPQNQQHFIDALNQAKEIYGESVDNGKRESITVNEWGIPESLNYNHRFSLKEKALSVLQPFYEANDASSPEKDFADFLDETCKNVEWWFKNGDRDRTFFAVPYTEGVDERPFYVDWIVKFQDGRIGLFDTKSGITAQTAKARAEGLAEYIRVENEKGKKLLGGIIVSKDGSWRYNDNAEYEYKHDDFSGWKFLS